MIPKCEECGCGGNESCLYPPPNDDSFEHGCQLDDHHCCPCCADGVNRMEYRPIEDGQVELFT